ncbi:MAG: hypothetical protein ACOCXQ_03040 [Patescibacteria group bacterium]
MERLNISEHIRKEAPERGEVRVMPPDELITLLYQIQQHYIDKQSETPTYIFEWSLDTLEKGMAEQQSDSEQEPDPDVIRLILLDEITRSVRQHRDFSSINGRILCVASPDIQAHSWSELQEEFITTHAVTDRQPLFCIQDPSRIPDFPNWALRAELVTLERQSLPMIDVYHQPLTEPSQRSREAVLHEDSCGGYTHQQKLAQSFAHTVVRTTRRPHGSYPLTPTYFNTFDNYPYPGSIAVPVATRVESTQYRNYAYHTGRESSKTHYGVGMHTEYTSEVAARLDRNVQRRLIITKRDPKNPLTWSARVIEEPIVNAVSTINNSLLLSIPDNSGNREETELDSIMYRRPHISFPEEHSFLLRKLHQSQTTKHVMKRDKFAELRESLRKTYPRRVAKRKALAERARQDDRDTTKRDIINRLQFLEELYKRNKAQEKQLIKEAEENYEHEFNTFIHRYQTLLSSNHK